MLITKTPFRISFFGGGSDLPEFYERSPGQVLNATISKFMYLTSHSFFSPSEVRLKYSQTETVDSISKIQHPILREALQMFQIDGGLEIGSTADIPSGTGLGSSSAFTVGLIHNLHARRGNFVTRETLAEEAVHIEISRLKEPIGKQDQYAAAFGGLNIFRFKSSGDVEIEPLYLKSEITREFQDSLMLFFTGQQRKASDILAQQKENLSQKDVFSVLQDMAALVPEARSVLYDGDISQFGRLLHETWTMKKKMGSHITTPEIDQAYEAALGGGAWGGKISGAGGGGFLLLCCPVERQMVVREALAPLQELSFSLEFEGSKVIYVGDESGLTSTS